MSEQVMTLDKAMSNAIASTEMEGFIVTAEQKELMKSVLKNEISLKEAIEILNRKYNR